MPKSQYGPKPVYDNSSSLLNQCHGGLKGSDSILMRCCLKKKGNIPYYVSSTDQPSEVHHSGSDLPYPNIQLLPQRLMGGPDQETVYRGADLPLEAQNHQDRVRYARKNNTRRDEGTKEVME